VTVHINLIKMAYKNRAFHTNIRMRSWVTEKENDHPAPASYGRNPSHSGRVRKEMKLKTLLIIASIVTFIFGIGFLLVPAWFEASYGVNLDAGGQLMGRFMGAVYFALAIIFWLGRNAQSTETRGILVAGGLSASALGLIVAIYDRVAGIENALAWSTVAILLLLTIGFGYFYFAKPVAD
jgi:hypothetical protein